jgi:hypothetical protein
MMMLNNAKAIVMMDEFLKRNKDSIVASVGEIKRNPNFWGFELKSNAGERISVAITPDYKTLEIFFKDEIYYPDENELPAILLQMKTGTYKPRNR